MKERQALDLLDMNYKVFNNKVIKFLSTKGIDYNNINKATKQSILFKLIKNCNRCSSASINKVVPISIIAPRVLVINKSNGTQELKESIILPRTYPSGYILSNLINQMGYSMSEVYITNLSFCIKSNNYSICRLWKSLELDLILSSVEVIILLGDDSFKYFYSTSQSITDIIGEIYKTELFSKNYIVVPMLHPTTLSKYKEYESLVYKIIKEVRGLLGGW